VASLKAQEQFDKSAFYAAMAADDINKVDEQLKAVEASSLSAKDAYSGALLMKKAGLAKGAGNKLNIFKEGHKKLEDAIEKNKPNIEFRFLRLMIQEHAPGILGYKSDIKTDGQLIKKSYKELPETVQKAIVDYSKKSKILNPSDF
jgi:hypothetical protein